MPIIFFVISLFLANQNAVTIAPKDRLGSNEVETVKTTETPSNGREYIIHDDMMP